ncbi:hypothetical protein [Teichococcus aestuarii]|uniref:hypothetical protein n=1 Tax=Teichococcus aestuarii TaxID=568898 RepID=UPI0036242AD1
MASIWDLLAARRLDAAIVFPAHIRALLESCQLQGAAPDDDDISGDVAMSAGAKPLGFFSLALTPPVPPVGFRLLFEAGPSFRFWLKVSALPGVRIPFGFVAGAPGAALKPASRMSDGDREWLVPAAGEVTLEGAALSILVQGTAGGMARLRLTPAGEQAEGIVALALKPTAVLIGDTGFGLDLPQGLVLDDSTTAKAEGETRIGGQAVPVPADLPAWRGLVVRAARFFLPESVPFLGAHAVDAHVEIGLDPPGIALAVHARVAATGHRPGIEVLIECQDPAASALQGFVPTLVEAAMTLPLDGRQEDVGGQALTFSAGRPVTARLRFARRPDDPLTRLTLGVEAQGAEGILSVHAPQGGPAARAAIGAGALATALVADRPPAEADSGGVVLHALLVAGLGLTAFLKDKGSVTLHGVELDAAGHGLPLGQPLKLTIDYSVDVVVVPIELGALSVRIRDEQPMRVRNRHVGLTIDPSKGGLAMFGLDFSRADMEIEDPGAWQVQGPASLFDILGTRSGRGSMWLEVDLRFKLELGPVKVSGATIRATLDPATRRITASLEGLDAAVSIPALVEGRGRFQLLREGGFAARLGLAILPLNLGASATVLYQPEGGSYLLFLRLGADLPGPLPVANTGLGIYGLAGSLGINAAPRLPPSAGADPAGADPIGQQLGWDSTAADAFAFQPGARTLGGEAVIGTVPDLGFSFSTKAGLFLTVPDLAIRAALWSKVMSPRPGIDDRPAGPEMGLAFKGAAVIAPRDGVTIALRGELNMPPLLSAAIPLGAWFPASGQPGVDAADWFIHLGADGYAGQGRGMGPARAVILPGLLEQSADAYLMVRGKGIERWPRGQPGLTIADGMVLAFGFGVDIALGPRPFAWAEVQARADLLLATHPLILAGFGRLAGSLHLGPFSIGVEADVAFIIAENAPAGLAARICGRIDLFFTDIEGCVDITLDAAPTRRVPPPGQHPLDRLEGDTATGDLAQLIDHHYERIAPLSRSAAGAPTVWPDTLLHLGFAQTPQAVGAFTGGQFPQAEAQAPPAEPAGSQMLEYRWSLHGLSLRDVTGDEDGPGTPVPGPLSAAWQKGKDGDPGRRPQAGELVLLTCVNDLWLDRLADGGASLPPSPAEDSETICRFEHAARIGWAVGAGAAAEAGGMRLPPDPVLPDPAASRFSALVTCRHDRLPGVALGAATAALLPPPLRYEPPEPGRLDPPLVVDPGLDPDRRFEGWLQLGQVPPDGPREAASRGQRQDHVAEIRPSAPLLRPRLWLVVDRWSDEGPAVSVTDGAGGVWRTSRGAGGATVTLPVPGGRVAVRFAPATPGRAEIASVLVRWAPAARLAMLGLCGITRAARAAAVAAAGAAAAAEAYLAAAAAGPQPPDKPTGTAVRCILQPGRTYRLDLDLRWTGTLYEQDESGARKAVATATAEEGKSYAPRDQGSQPTARAYFFRTARVPQRPAGAGPVPDRRPDYGTPERLAFLTSRRDIFEPEMLQRHLLGYTPAQSETARFRDDPVAAHFDAGHVAALARAYGFALRLGLRRVDVPHDSADPASRGRLLLLEPAWGPLRAPELLGSADRIRHERAGRAACPMPRPGGTLEAQQPLEGRAWYEVHVHARAGDGGADGRLPGVTFRTSRWRSPAEMMAGLGFPPAGDPGRPQGDIEIAALPAFPQPVLEGEDAAFEAAMEALGLRGWPPAGEAPRVSQLWLRPSAGAGPAWRCAGVLVEAPEPIHRPGRAELGAPRVLTRAAPAQGLPLPVRRRDRGGTRLLLLATAPFAPQRFQRPLPRQIVPPVLLLPLADLRAGATVTGRLALRERPGFAGEA